MLLANRLTTQSKHWTPIFSRGVPCRQRETTSTVSGAWLSSVFEFKQHIPVFGWVRTLKDKWSFPLENCAENRLILQGTCSSVYSLMWMSLHQRSRPLHSTSEVRNSTPTILYYWLAKVHNELHNGPTTNSTLDEYLTNLRHANSTASKRKLQCQYPPPNPVSRENWQREMRGHPSTNGANNFQSLWCHISSR